MVASLASQLVMQLQRSPAMALNCFSAQKMRCSIGLNLLEFFESS